MKIFHPLIVAFGISAGLFGNSVSRAQSDAGAPAIVLPIPGGMMTPDMEADRFYSYLIKDPRYCGIGKRHGVPAAVFQDVAQPGNETIFFSRKNLLGGVQAPEVGDHRRLLDQAADDLDRAIDEEKRGEDFMQSRRPYMCPEMR